MKSSSCSTVALAILIAASVVTMANGQTPIPKMKPIPAVKPIPKVCDPNAWGNYLRKKRIVEELLDSWLERGKEARHNFRDDLLEIMRDVKKEDKRHRKIEKRIKQAERAYSDYVETRYSATEAALKKDAAAELGATARGAATAGLVMELALDAAKLDLAWGNYRDAAAANDKDLQRVDALWQSALADLRQALSQTEACQRDREKADADEVLKEKAKALIDDWNIGGVTYRDPRGDILDEKAALEEAKQILLNQRSGFYATPRGFEPVAFVRTAAVTATTGGSQRAAAALTRVERAHHLFRSSMDAIIDLMSAEEEFAQALAEVRRGM